MTVLVTTAVVVAAVLAACIVVLLRRRGGSSSGRARVASAAELDAVARSASARASDRQGTGPF